MLSFCALVAATVGAFFITQHLKVSTPLLAGFPRPVPGFINPTSDRACGSPPVSHHQTTISFYLLHRSDHVDVYVVNSAGIDVATLASNRYMRGGQHPKRSRFVWDGREDNGTVAPDGVYYIKVALRGQGRTVDITNQAGALQTVTVDTRPPQPRVLSVSPHLIPTTDGTKAAIRYTGTEHRGASVLIYRTDLPTGPRRVKTFGTPGKGTASWDGLILSRPAPAGVYLIGLRVADGACNLGLFPPRVPVSPGETPGAGITVRYLAAQPPLDAVAPGVRATVFVDSRKQRYRWSLEQPSRRRPLASGSSASYTLTVRLPRGRPGLYVLSLRAPGHATAVPLVAHAAHPARLLVVLPALSWQGLNPGDEDGDGVPDTLTDGAAVSLERPFADGLPTGFPDLEGVLGYLDASHRAYDLTTDLGLIDGTGPTMAGHQEVLLAGTEEWVTAALANELRAYVQNGGRVVSLGISSLLRRVTVSGARALSPTGPAVLDVFGARPGPVLASNGQLIGETRDGLNIFRGTPGLFTGYRLYESIQPPAGTTSISEAGATTSAPSIVGFRLGRGSVVDIALPGFGARLAHDAGAQQFIARVLGAASR